VHELRCEAVRWVNDEPFPGLVEVQFVDAAGRRWSLDVISVGQSAVAYEGCGDGSEGQEVFRLALVAAVQASAAGQPGHGPLHDPAVSSQVPGRLDALAGEAVPDAAGSKPSPQMAIVVALVAVQFPGPPASRAATGADGRDATDQRDEGLAVVEVRGGDADRQGQALAVDDEVDFRSLLPRSVGFGPVSCPL
jgi:hypothetical protein